MSILYLLGKSSEINKPHLYKTFICKFISLLELRAAQKYANHFFMLDFQALENGPIPYSFMKYITENNAIMFFLKDKNYKKYFNWDYFSETDKEILEEITNYILEVKNVQQLSEEIHIKCPSWRKFWTERKKDSKQNKMNFSFDIRHNNEDEEELKEIIHFYKESCYKNGKNCSIFIDNKDTLNDEKFSLLLPLIKIDERYIFFIRLTTQKPKKHEKNYIEINIKVLPKTSYIRFDRNYSDIHIINIEKIENYRRAYIPNLEKNYKKEILKGALNCRHISQIYLNLILLISLSN
ncbi:hypothetical protein [Spiroplasma endosymbiont of Nebria brevicollis]|uniref:hypothetical protein n=1 Tax=Spiroplasma endosymbiont of Nebria brevicollis TaxID=3066284 RepID=UPI00313C7174